MPGSRRSRITHAHGSFLIEGNTIGKVTTSPTRARLWWEIAIVLTLGLGQSAIYAIVQLGNYRAVTKHISEITCEASAVQGDLIELGLQATHFGVTSLTMRAVARNMITRKRILTIDRIVFVSLGEDGRPTPHGYSEITYNRDRMPTERLVTGTVSLPKL